MRKTAIKNNIRMETKNGMIERNKHSISSPMRTPRRAYSRTEPNPQTNGFIYNYGKTQPFPTWTNPQQFMIYSNQQQPNFFIPLHQPNPNIIQQKAQQTQNTQQNQT